MKTLKLTIALILCCSMAALAQALPFSSNNYSGSAPVHSDIGTTPWPATHSISIDFYLAPGYTAPFATGSATFDGNAMTYLRFDTSLGLCYEIYVGMTRYLVYLQISYDSWANQFYYVNTYGYGPVTIYRQ